MPTQIDRRDVLKKALVGSTIVWAAPTVLAGPAAAAASNCNCTSSPVLFFNAANGTHATNGTCKTYVDVTKTVCRKTVSQVVNLSSNSTGTGAPDFDELATVYVTSPTGITRSRNFIRYQNDCRDPATTVADWVASPFAAPEPITDLFGNQCGTFTVRVAVRNAYTPWSYATTYVVPK